MKVNYTFINGEISSVEVSEEIGTLIMDSRRKEHADDERQRYHCLSSDGADFEGEAYADTRTPESELERMELCREMQEAINSLTDIQKSRLAMYLDGMSMREIARIEGVQHKAVAFSFEGIRKKFKKFLK